MELSFYAIQTLYKLKCYNKTNQNVFIYFFYYYLMLGFEDDNIFGDLAPKVARNLRGSENMQMFRMILKSY